MPNKITPPKGRSRRATTTGQSSRRTFLVTAGSGLAATVVASGFPSIVPSSVLGAASPSNRINVGAIGTGRISRGHDLPGIMRHDIARVVAACDLDRKRVDDAKVLIEKFYTDKGGTPFTGEGELRGRRERPLARDLQGAFEGREIEPPRMALGHDVGAVAAQRLHVGKRNRGAPPFDARFAAQLPPIGGELRAGDADDPFRAGRGDPGSDRRERGRIPLHVEVAHFPAGERARSLVARFDALRAGGDVECEAARGEPRRQPVPFEAIDRHGSAGCRDRDGGAAMPRRPARFANLELARLCFLRAGKQE